MRHRRSETVLLALLALGAARPLAAQFGMGVDMGGGLSDPEEERQRRIRLKRRAVSPFVEALYQTVGAADWRAVELSTSTPREELARYMSRGLYRLEMTELVVLASRAKKPLKGLVEKRSDGKPLAELAKEAGVPFDALYDDAVGLRDKIEARMASLSVASSSAPAVSSVPVSAPLTAPATGVRGTP